MSRAGAVDVKTRPSWARSLCALFLSASFACDSPTAPSPYALPPEDLSPDPRHLSLGAEIYFCGDWNPLFGKPPGDHVLVDVNCGTGDLNPLLDHPVESQRQLMQSVGAIIRASFHFPGYRVWIPTDSIPVLATRDAVGLRGVPEPSRWDVQVMVYYGAHGFFGADSVFIRDLGGRLLQNLDAIHIVIVTMERPNRSLTTLRTDSQVVWILPEYTGCDGQVF